MPWVHACVYCGGCTCSYLCMPVYVHVKRVYMPVCPWLCMCVWMCTYPCLCMFVYCGGIHANVCGRYMCPVCMLVYVMRGVHTHVCACLCMCRGGWGGSEDDFMELILSSFMLALGLELGSPDLCWKCLFLLGCFMLPSWMLFCSKWLFHNVDSFILLFFLSLR